MSAQEPSAAAEVDAIYNRELSPEEWTRRLAAALAETEHMAELEALIDWFSRRYPTAKDRLVYARRQYAQVMRKKRIVPR